MVTVVDADDARGVKKRMVHGADVFERARDFYHAHEDLRSEAIQVTDPLGTPLYALRFRHNRIEGVPQNMQLSTYVRPFWHYGEDAPRMDFTYLEAHDAFLFLEVEEYSCFLATLIGHRYPEKTVAFSDRRASLFFEDVEIAETTDEFLAAHPSLVAERGPEIIIGRRATRHIQMNEPGLLHHLAAINGRYRTYDQGTVPAAAVPLASPSGATVSGASASGNNDGESPRVAAALEQNTQMMLAMQQTIAALSQTVTTLQQRGIPAHIQKYGTGGLIEEVKSGLKFDQRYNR
jgi:hypothetical protein